MNNLLGVQATLLHQVRVEDLASNWQNDIDVLATPVLLWLAEITCMDALRNKLADGEMTVGIGHTMQHLAPTPLGDTIRLTATIIEVVKQKLVFAIEGYDGQERIVFGQHERALVQREKFLKKVEHKQARYGAKAASQCCPGCSTSLIKHRELAVLSSPFCDACTIQFDIEDLLKNAAITPKQGYWRE